jgi:hypothetical protein
MSLAAHRANASVTLPKASCFLKSHCGWPTATHRAAGPYSCLRYIAVEANPAGESSLRRRADPQPEAAHHPAQAQLDIVVLRPQKFARCRSARTSCADSDLQSTGRTLPSRIPGRCNGVFAERSTSNAFVTRRVSSSSSIKSGFRMSPSIHCGSGPASSLIRAIVKSRPRNHSITTSGSPPPWPLARSPARDHDAHARAFQ